MSHAINHTDVVVASGNTEATGSVDTIGWLVSAIICPAEFDGTTITFKAASRIDGTFRPVHNVDGTLLTVTTAASRHVLLEPQTFAGARYLKLVCGSAQSGTDTVLKVALHRES